MLEGAFMTLILQLPTELEQRLRRQAHQQGKGLEEYAQEVLDKETTSTPIGLMEKRKPLAGRLAHLKLKTTTWEEFQDVRREMFANFPREFPTGNEA